MKVIAWKCENVKVNYANILQRYIDAGKLIIHLELVKNTCEELLGMDWRECFK